MKTLIIAMLCLYVGLGNQNTGPDFNAQSQYHIDENETLALSSSIQKSGVELTWTQHIDGQNMPTLFTVISSNGNFDTQTLTGELTFELALGTSPASLTISGGQEGTTASLTSELPDGNISYTLILSSLSFQ